MDISEFSLSRTVLEVRYDLAYLLWGQAGAIWSDFDSKWPKAKNTVTQPNECTFIVDNKYEISIKINSSHVTAVNPAKAEHHDFLKLCDFMLDQIYKRLGVKEFTRIGFRQIFSKRYPTINDANKKLLSLGHLKVPTGKLFGIEGTVASPQIIYTLEDDSLGCRVNIKTQNKKIEFEGILGEDEVTPQKHEYNELIADFDYYTRANASYAQFKAEEWVEQAMRVIRRDSTSVLS